MSDSGLAEHTITSESVFGGHCIHCQRLVSMENTHIIKDPAASSKHWNDT